MVPGPPRARRSLLHQFRESRVQLALGASLQHVQSKSERSTDLATRIERIYKQANHGCFRHYFMKQLMPFWFERNAQPTYTRDIAAGPVHPGDEAVLHWVTASLDLLRSAPGHQRNVSSWHMTSVRCDTKLLPFLNEVQTEVAPSRDSGLWHILFCSDAIHGGVRERPLALRSIICCDLPGLEDSC